MKLILAQPSVLLNTGATDTLRHIYNRDKERILAIEFCANTTIDIIKGGTALHYACRAGNADVMELLVGRCGSFDKLDDRGMTPLLHFKMSEAGSIEAMGIYTSAERKFMLTQAIFKGELSGSSVPLQNNS